MNVTESESAAVPMPHERLDVWRVAIEFDRAVVAAARSAPRGHAWLADQAMRASGSAVLNLAEGLGREAADRVRVLRISRGSLLEADAAVALLTHRGACSAATRDGVHALAARFVALLHGLCRAAG